MKQSGPISKKESLDEAFDRHADESRWDPEGFNRNFVAQLLALPQAQAPFELFALPGVRMARLPMPEG